MDSSSELTPSSGPRTEKNSPGPADQPTIWYQLRGLEQQGPFSWEQLRQRAAHGDLSSSDLVWGEGMTAWVPAPAVPGLFFEAPFAGNEATVVGAFQPASPARPPVQVPGYEVLGELGRGGMGIVYKARQTKLNRVVALKMIRDPSHADAHDIARFRTEAEAVAQLQHPNIVQIYEVGEHDGLPYFSLEFVEGGSLASRLKSNLLLPPREAAALIETLARAMEAAHRKGILHRDLKPANILMGGEPAREAGDQANPSTHLSAPALPKITDFGLAKRLDQAGGPTKTGAIMGSPSYMPPEQATGDQSKMGPCSDIYALGAILYHLLAGRPPFLGETPMSTVFLVTTEEPVPPSRLQPKVPRDLQTICLKCLQKEPKKRYASAAELADDLRRFLAGEPILARPMGRAERAWRWCRRNPVPASLLVAVTLGAAFGFWYLSRLSESLVRFSALVGAAQESEMLDEVNDFYSARVADRVKKILDQKGKAGPRLIDISPLYLKEPGRIPPPATFTIDLGDHITKESKLGVTIRLYSNYPFIFRKRPPPDLFEQEALKRLKADPQKPFYRFENMEGRPVLRYATARIMKQSCVDCHNGHPDGPPIIWKVGDVRGVLEVIRPLDRDVARTSEGLRGTFFLVGGLSVGLLLVCGLVLFLGNRRRAAPQAG